MYTEKSLDSWADELIAQIEDMNCQFDSLEVRRQVRASLDAGEGYFKDETD